MLTQVMAVHLLRTDKIPFLESCASWQISLLGVLGIACVSVMCATDAGAVLDLGRLPGSAVGIVLLMALLYAIAVLFARKAYKARYQTLL